MLDRAVEALALEGREGHRPARARERLVLDGPAEREERRLAQPLGRDVAPAGDRGVDRRAVGRQLAPLLGALDRRGHRQAALAQLDDPAQGLDDLVAVAAIARRRAVRNREAVALLPHPQGARRDAGPLRDLLDREPCSHPKLNSSSYKVLKVPPFRRNDYGPRPSKGHSPGTSQGPSHRSHRLRRRRAAARAARPRPRGALPRARPRPRRPAVRGRARPGRRRGRRRPRRGARGRRRRLLPRPQHGRRAATSPSATGAPRPTSAPPPRPPACAASSTSAASRASGETTSEHLRSREEVAEILAEHVDEVVHVRAAMVIGAGSASFQMLRHLVLRLPVMVTPRWIDTRSQPVAIADVVGTLAALADHPDPPAEVQLGGADVLTYREMMRRFARVAGRRPPFVVPVPALTPRLSSYWVALVTPVGIGLARPLIDGLRGGDGRPHPTARRAQRRARAASTTRCARRSIRRNLYGRCAARSPSPPRCSPCSRSPSAARGAPAGRSRASRTSSTRPSPTTAARSARCRPPTSSSPTRSSRSCGARATSSGWRARTGASSRACTLGIIRVKYTRDERFVCCSAGRSCCSRFQAPEYEMDATRGIVRWRIERGVLVSRRGRGATATSRSTCSAVRGRRPTAAPRCTSRSRSRTSIRRSPRDQPLGVPNTQSRIHVLVTYGFLRSLAHLDLAESQGRPLRRRRGGPRPVDQRAPAKSLSLAG